MKVIKIFFFCFLIALSADMSAQKYAVYFTDKNDSPYSVNNPEEFLSARSIARRTKFDIETTIQDLPVNPQYVQQIEALGAQVSYTSRWLNCALVSCNQSIINQIEQLSIVDDVVYISPGNYKGTESTIDKFSLEKEGEALPKTTDKGASENYNYGDGYDQINQLNGIPVHEQGYTGDGILVAIIDGGFENANSVGAFSRLYQEGRIVLEFDVVTPGGNIYGSNTGNHGTKVLSCMASYLDGQFIGTAPEASFALIRTEDGATEYLIECYNWVIGAEAADSIGADIINTSLGYNTFDDASMNYTYSQMDGQTAVSSIGAKTAIEKGIFVTVSAGNSNGTSWPWVSTPSDVVNAATIGAVNVNGTIAYFSSIGPNGAGDPKPNVLARGVSATVVSQSGYVTTESGTSFSSPISCGMYTCLIQANPSIPPAQLRDIVDATGDRYPNHDDVYGYGIPDFAEALDVVLSMTTFEITQVTINDELGNNDGKLNPGETVTLDLSVKNKTNQAISNVNATLTTDNEDITMIDAGEDFGSFTANQTKDFTDAFSFSLSENAAVNNEIRFSVLLTFSDGNSSSLFSITIYGVDLNYQFLTISDGAGNANGMLDPGETANMIISIINNGNETVSNVTGNLSSSSDLITINTNDKAFGSIAPEQSQIAAYNVTLSSSAVPGEIDIPFTLILTGNNGYSKELSFNYRDLCNINFYLHDSFGDGWNGAAIIVSFDDGSPSQTLTITSGNSANYVVEAAMSTNITLSWQSGSWNYECSFEVEYDDGTEIYAAPTGPQSGVFYTFENTCGAGSSSDCDPISDLAASVSAYTYNLTWTAPATGSPSSYNIYINSEFVATTTTTFYHEYYIAPGTYNCCVEAVYSDCISQTVCIDIEIENIEPPLWAPQYAVHFKDKNNSPYSTDNPSEYLSERAIARREAFNITITEEDLPVNPDYVNFVKATGAYVKWTSKWSNSALVYADETMLNAISNLDCVDSVVYVKPAEGKLNPKLPVWDNDYKSNTYTMDFDYGAAQTQIAQLNGITVHEQGYAGENVIIAVLDAGFNNVNNVTAFDHLRDDNRILLELDIAEKGGDIYSTDISSHGTAVLSCMGSFLNSQHVGTAPEASYALIRTEDAATEYLIEEYNWMIGAEAADSLGADIINSSLSYSTFDDSSMDHQYSDMDGETAISSIAAKMAVARGVFISVSAGNSNGSSWPWVGTPADAVDAMTVGAVSSNGAIASFSSIGPNGAGNPKPNIVAMGVDCAVVRPDNQINYGSGTSFASPIACGMTACMIQASYHQKSPIQVKTLIEESCDRYPEHFIDYGYGIPNFGNVLNEIILSNNEFNIAQKLFVYPNPTTTEISVGNFNLKINRIYVTDILGRVLYSTSTDVDVTSINLAKYKSGVLFVVAVYENGTTETVKVIKQ
jgi:serine protease AprX